MVYDNDCGEMRNGLDAYCRMVYAKMEWSNVIVKATISIQMCENWRRTHVGECRGRVISVNQFNGVVDV